MPIDPGQHEGALLFYGVQPGDRCRNCELLLGCLARIAAVRANDPPTLDSMNAASNANDLVNNCPTVPAMPFGSTTLVNCVSRSTVNKL
jgi:hypothetical protein